ncbi:p-hydroxylaminobenzoate lyase [Plenodomus tracheiphilus IPT5]|uniref:p-hydroxylaminobenzoate lyase n=1 Tax=Plenodomus tracheiphilus IPT5 TaxID=1408161 RepID=A0A6A7B5G4_9PLEO|nr:p-hydroxylaminobenzoate lyase [Plenodomus tracheiphilus IPT5]
MQAEVPGSTPPAEVDLAQYPLAKKLLQRCQDFFSEVENLTPGQPLEAHLNKTYGPGHPIYEDLCTLTLAGFHEGWLANTPITGPNYRRSKLALPSESTRYFSITAVYVDARDQDVFSGQHHSHPYGEINCVVVIDEGAELRGMKGWQGKGWTAPGPGTHHYPQFRGGRLISLFFLPAGRISYSADPEDPQPASV